MKLYTQAFKDYAKVLCGIAEKGHTKNEAIYFDFKKSKAYVSSNKGIGRLSFMCEFEEGEVVENFFVPLDKFLIVISPYTELEVKGRLLFNGKESFELQSFNEEVKEDLDKPFSIEEAHLVLDQDSNLLSHINFCGSYLGEDINPSLNAIFIMKNRLAMGDDVMYYGGDLVNVKENITLPLSVAKMMGGLTKHYSLYKKNNKIIICINQEMYIVVAESLDLTFPEDINSEAFISYYSHKDSLLIKRADLTQVVKFLEPFAKDAPNQRVFIEVEKEELIIQVKDSNKIKRDIAISEVSTELIGRQLIVSLLSLKAAIVDAGGEYIKIQISSDLNVPCMNTQGFRIDSETKDKIFENRHIVLNQLRE